MGGVRFNISYSILINLITPHPFHHPRKGLLILPPTFPLYNTNSRFWPLLKRERSAELTSLPLLLRAWYQIPYRKSSPSEGTSSKSRTNQL